jgi:hypothetical protein
VYVPGPSDVFYSGTSIFLGTFEGTGRFCGHSTEDVVRSDGSVPFIETDTFTGIVHGCGTGHVTYSVRGSVSPFDPATQSVPAQEDWKIVAQGGTEGLGGLMSGGGHNNATLISLTSSEAGTFTGSVKCVGRTADH